ncbi:hypothetical protein RFI_04956 [Reticulomyxa filosa]|uniref:Uncharacterized protein n=1 Tax=Reticulomyxa filosa TaxID=46433 RepID=X6P261_RETFI|nr:hypothetical protein RFI_04956 [Reticulomyxa filosa]|eukprot:ETO32159.1 hypothetical protein RFI_04956 [Reticulomyxa filosa]
MLGTAPATIITPEFAYRLGLTELEMEKDLNDVEQELEKVDTTADTTHNYPYLGADQQPVAVGQNADSSDETTSSESEQPAPPAHPGLHPNCNQVYTYIHIYVYICIYVCACFIIYYYYYLKKHALIETCLPKKSRRRRKKNKWREQAQQRFRAFGRGVEKSFLKLRIGPKRTQGRDRDRGSGSDTDGEKEKESAAHAAVGTDENMIEMREFPRQHSALRNIAEDVEMEEKYPHSFPTADDYNEFDSDNNMSPDADFRQIKHKDSSVDEVDFASEKTAQDAHSKKVDGGGGGGGGVISKSSSINDDSEPKKKKYGGLSLNLLTRYSLNKNVTNITSQPKPKEHESESPHSDSDEDHRAIVINVTEDHNKKNTLKSFDWFVCSFFFPFFFFFLRVCSRNFWYFVKKNTQFLLISLQTSTNIFSKKKKKWRFDCPFFSVFCKFFFCVVCFGFYFCYKLVQMERFRGYSNVMQLNFSC